MALSAPQPERQHRTAVLALALVTASTWIFVVGAAASHMVGEPATTAQVAAASR